jgi:hypothetical protein
MHTRQLMRLLTTLVAGTLLFSCSTIKIETGQTQEEAIQSAKAQARQIRSDWANQFQQAAPLEMAQLLSRHIDSVSTWYVAYGFEVATQWREGNTGRGENVPDREMREVVAVWTEKQQPILAAYEDNLEYGLEQIKETGYFGQDFFDLLSEFADQYYKVYSAVFYPSGSVEEYEETLNRVKYETESLSIRLKTELDRY